MSVAPRGLSSRVRGFFERLPEPPSWAPYIMFGLIHSGNYKTFVQQCLDNLANLVRLGRRRRGGRLHTARMAGAQYAAARETPLAQALRWERCAQLDHWVASFMCSFVILKYRLLSYIGNQPNQLDCLLLGRFRYIGRTNAISGEIASVFILSHLVNMWTVYVCQPRFKFYALEFLMTSQEEVARDELRAELESFREAGHELRAHSERAHSARRSRELVDNELLSKRRTLAGVKLARAHTSERKPGVWVGVNSIAFLRNPYGAKEGQWILRPNRTTKSWLTLNLCTKVILYSGAYGLLSWIAVMYYLLAGSVLTNLGFEMAYPACVAWLRDTQARPGAGANVSFSDIYLAPRVLAHEIRIDDIPARIPLDTRDLERANWYTVARIAMDLFENHLIYLQCIVLFNVYFYLLAIHAVDVVLNAIECKARLGRLLERLEAQMELRHRQQAAKSDCYSSLGWAQQAEQPAEGAEPATPSVAEGPTFVTHTSNLWELIAELRTAWDQTPPELPLTSILNDQVDEHLRMEIAELQAILSDHFQTLMHGYNLCVAYTFGFLGLTWLGYTAAVCVWMNSIHSRAVEIEFLINEISVTIFCMALTVAAALVRSHNLQLYRLITQAMALDPDWLVTKPRWTAILRYFYPKPFHCFFLFGTTEISTLLGLKLTSWILSAFIVLANFFYYKQT